MYAASNPNSTFEYGVILNGSQTRRIQSTLPSRFEYGVILNGSQTIQSQIILRNLPRFRIFSRLIDITKLLI